MLNPNANNPQIRMSVATNFDEVKKGKTISIKNRTSMEFFEMYSKNCKANFSKPLHYDSPRSPAGLAISTIAITT